MQFQQSIYIKKLPTYYCKNLFRFLTRNHRLPIETGRWKSTPTNERKCSQCNDIGDEYHYLLKCPQFNDIRKKYIKRYYYKRPNMIKFTQLLASENIPKLKQLSCFVEKIMKNINSNW